MDNTTPPPSAPTPPVSPSPTPSPNSQRQWDMWCHLAALSGLVIPFGHLLGPLIIWQMKRNELPSVDEHGKESFNFQLSMLIYLMASGVLAVIGTLLCIGWMVVPVIFVIPIVALVLAVVAGIKANDGIFYRYPFNLRLIK